MTKNNKNYKIKDHWHYDDSEGIWKYVNYVDNWW